MSAPPNEDWLLIATMLPAEGFCGVQTHVQTIAAIARAAGRSARIVTPYEAPAWQRRVANGVRRVLRRASREVATLWAKEALAHHLRGELERAMSGSTGRAVTVYAQDPMSAAVALDLRRSGRAFRLVSAVHYNGSEAEESAGNGETAPGGALWNRLFEREARVLPQVDRVIFVSDFMRRVVTARVPPIRSAVVIPNLGALAAHAEVAGEASGDLISIGTLEPRKNQSFLLRVIAEAGTLGRRYRLTLAGDGPQRAALEREAARLGVREQVTFLGYVPGAARLIGGHRAYAHAARLENFPFVLVEALQRGVPLLAPAVGGIPELFDDGVEGRYWPLDDARGAAELLLETLEPGPAYVAMGQAARRRYEQRYAPEVLAPRWLEAIYSPDAAAVPGDAASPQNTALRQ